MVSFQPNNIEFTQGSYFDLDGSNIHNIGTLQIHFQSLLQVEDYVLGGHRVLRNAVRT